MMNRIRLYKVLASTFFFTLSLCAYEPEYIQSFDSAIQVLKDGSMQVQETIVYVNQNVQGKRGIMRDFPTRYKDRFGSHVVVKFEVQQILRNGKPVPYHLKELSNGYRVYIGDAQKIVPPGTYTYTITYKTNRQLGFFEKHDELYWNVTGNGWPFWILQATAQVRLPHNIPANALRVEGYTGLFGAQGQNYTAKVAPDGSAVFATTKPLAPREGLSVVVSWPKGFVQEPTWLTRLGYFLHDNSAVLILLLGLLLLLAWYFFAWLQFKNAQQLGTVIPLFYPPQNLLPSAVRTLLKYGYDAKAFTAEVVNMAVHGKLTIEHQEGSWITSSSYTLKEHLADAQADANKTEHQVEHDTLCAILFQRASHITISQAQQPTIKKAMDALQSMVSRTLSGCFDHDYSYLGWGVLITGVSIFAAWIIADDFTPLAVGLVILMAIINALMMYLLRGYTAQGLKLKTEILGFKLFLETTETERLKIVGTPPTKNPELYETYLPYAIALGVEQAWSQQFAPIFARMQQEGHAYVPVWYVGSRPFSAATMDSFGSHMSSSLNTVISSSSTPPGSSSGSGGSGSSGGGGGGGGGGSW